MGDEKKEEVVLQDIQAKERFDLLHKISKTLEDEAQGDNIHRQVEKAISDVQTDPRLDFILETLKSVEALKGAICGLCEHEMRRMIEP